MKLKNTNQTYTVSLTGEQIKLIRSLYLRMEQIWVHHKIAESLGKYSTVVRTPLYECHFCLQASYESAAAIDHKKECIVIQGNTEFAQMNEVFIQALERKMPY